VTVLERQTFDVDRPASRTVSLMRQWPVLTCLLLSALFMVATNDLNATSAWQEATRDEVQKKVMELQSGRPSRQLAFMLMGLYGFFAFVWPARRFRISPVLFFPLITFLAWCGCSLLWSTDITITAKRLFVFALIAMAVLGFVRQNRLKDLALLALIGGSIQMVASIGAELLWMTGDYGASGYRFSGLQHPNHSGINAVILIFGCAYFYDRTKLRRFLLWMGVAAIILLLTKSRSALIAGLAGLTIFAGLRWPGRKILFVSILGATGLSCFLLLDAAGLVPEHWSNVIHMGRGDAEKTALTGRPLVWKAALEYFGDEPTRYLTGVGYQTFWTSEAADYVTNRLWFHISEGHNAFFDLTLEVGLVGVLFYACLLLGSLVRWVLAAHQKDSAAYAMAAGIMTFVLVHSLTESTTIDPNFVSFLSYSTMAFAALRTPRWFASEQPETPFEEIECVS
jgi:O-antigen ligase